MTDIDLKNLLDYYAGQINTPTFIADDPVQFPRRFSDKRDIEIASLLVSTIAWGNRTMICRDADRLLNIMNNQPYRYVLGQVWRDLPQANIHRTFFTANLRHYLAGLHAIYSRYTCLEDFADKVLKGVDDYHPWHLANAISHVITEANDGNADSRCLPLNLNATALKRFNMALRWLVRNDGIVDMGVWSVISPSQLYIPLDVHVGNISRQLGLLERKANDRRSVELLTGRLRHFCPSDPVIYDFALFGIGVANRSSELAEYGNNS